MSVRLFWLESTEGHLHCVPMENAAQCTTLMNLITCPLASISRNIIPVPYENRTLRAFVFLLRAPDKEALLYLKRHDMEHEALILTLANWLECRRAISLIAWHTASRIHGK